MGADLLYEGEGTYGHYQVADVVYAGRPARVLYSGDRQAAQSGVAQDGGDMLFDYNQRFLEVVRGLKPRRLLLIGGGALTLPQAIASEFPTLQQDVVERDGLLLAIAERYFSFRRSANLHVHITDGRRFLEEVQSTYDLILIDAFDDAVVPLPLRTVEAMQATYRVLRAGGVLAMNYIASYHGRRVAGLAATIAAVREAFQSITLFPASNIHSLWIPQNFILTAQDGQRDLEAFLRYAPLALPQCSAREALHDAE